MLEFCIVVGVILGDLIGIGLMVMNNIMDDRRLCTCRNSRQPSPDGYCSWRHSGYYGY